MAKKKLKSDGDPDKPMESREMSKTRATSEPKNDALAEMNWARVEFEMLPSELAALTDLQVRGELPPDAGLTSLLEWCRNYEISRNQLREAGDRIRVHDSAAHRAYQDRLDRATREWVEPAQVKRKTPSPETTAMDTYHVDHHEEDAGGGAVEGAERALLARLQVRRELPPSAGLPELIAWGRENNMRHRYNLRAAGIRIISGMPERRLRRAYKAVQHLDGAISPSERALLARLQDRRELPPSADLPQLIEWGHANGMNHRCALRAAGIRIVGGKPGARLCRANKAVYQQRQNGLSRDEVEMPQQVHAVKQKDTADVFGRNIDDLDEMNQHQPQDGSTLLAPSPPRGIHVEAHDSAGMLGLPMEHGQDSRRIAADNIVSFTNDVAPDLQNLQGDIIVVQYEQELDLPVRLHTTNGELLDDMDIDGV